MKRIALRAGGVAHPDWRWQDALTCASEIDPTREAASARDMVGLREHGDLELDGQWVYRPEPANRANWLIGSTGPVIDDTTFGPQPPGYVDSHGAPVTAGDTTSLYEAQRNDAAELREFHWAGGEGDWTDPLSWQERATPAVYTVSQRDYLVGDIDGFTFDGSGSVDAAYTSPAWQASIAGTSALPLAGFDDLSGNENVAFTIQHQLDAGERVVHGQLALAMRLSASGNASNDFVRLFNTNPEHRLGFDELGWDTAVSPAGTFVGVLDLGHYLQEMQSGAVNVQLNDDTGLDWAMYIATVANPISDPSGPAVFIDSGGVASIVAATPSVRWLQVGGSGGGELTITGTSGVNVTNDYVQMADGRLTLELSATALNEPFFEIADVAQLDGVLSIELTIGFAPEFGDEFPLLTASGGVSGQFDDVELPALGNGLVWNLTYGPGDVLLRVTLAGDYNDDSAVDATDYVLWRITDSSPQGYSNWAENFGAVAAGASASLPSEATVPEASSLLMLVIGSVIALAKAQRLKSSAWGIS